MRNIVFVFAAVALAGFTACDIPGSTDDKNAEAIAEVQYRTPLADEANAATRAPDGTVVVTGLTDGRIGRGDWTNGFPLVLRVQPDGSVADTTVYRNVRYGSALGAAPLNGRLSVLIEKQNYDQTGVEPKALTLYRTNSDGTRRDTLFRPDSTFAARDPLHRTTDGGVLLGLSRTDENDTDLIKLRDSGSVDWTFRMPDVQSISAVAEASNGDLFVSGRPNGRQFDLARLGPEGAVRWRRTYGTDSTDAPFRRARSIATIGNKPVVLGTRKPADADDPHTRSVTLTWFDSTGAFVKEKSYGTGSADASTLATLPGGRLALSYEKDYGAPGSLGETRAFLLYLGPRGTVQQRWRVGPRTGTTRVTSLVPLSGGRVAVVGSTGPEAIGGYGGDDFDVLVAIYRKK